MDRVAPHREARPGGCPPESTIVGLLEHRLSSEQRAELEAHVDACASCRQLLVELSADAELASTAGESHTTELAHPVADAPRLAKGTVVGRFVVLAQLGEGGMGVVYMAYDPELDRKVALKLLRARRREDGAATPELLLEAQVTARITHANVIAIYDVGTYRGQVFSAMELVEGGTLRRWMARPRTWREVVDVFVAAGEGLAAAHAAGVVHRDFKPENVLLGGDGRIKVSDFGLASGASPSATYVAGTPAYLPVEWLQGGGDDARGDQFSFCVALFEALYGRRPFSASSGDERVTEVRRGPALESTDGRIPGRLARAVRRGLAFAPEDRFPSMRALLAELRGATPGRRWRRGAASVGAALALGATAAAMYLRAPAPPSPCADEEAGLAGIWDLARRHEVRAAFRRTRAPSAFEVFERVAARLDDYAGAWTSTSIASCVATRRGAQPQADHDLRVACLHKARALLSLFSDELRKADARIVSSAMATADALPPLDRCEDVAALREEAEAQREHVARTAAPATAPTNATDPTVPAGRVDGQRDPSAATYAFRLPFGCGDIWKLTRQARRGVEQLDFTLPGNGPAEGLAVYGSAPGWVARVRPERGEVVLGHGDGWFTQYRHMTEINVALHQYIGRGHSIGRVGSIDLEGALGGPAPARLRYAQRYAPGAVDPDFDAAPHPDQPPPSFEAVPLDAARVSLVTSTNNCFGGGAPAGSVRFDIPRSKTPFSRSEVTLELVTRRSPDHVLFERRYDKGWHSALLGHTIVGQPAVAVFQGQLHVIARKSDGTLFVYRFDPLAGWTTTYLEGKVAGDAEVALNHWRRALHVAARGEDGRLYQWWTAPDGRWSRGILMGPTQVEGTPAMVSHYDALYLGARTPGGSLHIWKTDRRGLMSQWDLPGVAGDPDAVVDPRTGAVTFLARGPDDRLYLRRSTDPGHAADHPEQPWTEPELVDARRTIAGAPAVIAFQLPGAPHAALHIIARDATNALHHWWDAGTWQWEPLPGAYTSDPSLTYHNRQLQTFGRDPSGALYTVWFDPPSGMWSAENHGVMIAR